jgi:carbonic anhydrase
MVRKYKKFLFKNNFSRQALSIFQIALSSAFLLYSASSFAAEASLPPWSYDDDYTGQVDWGSIKGYEICETGSNQSPVIISYTKTTDLPALNYSYIGMKGILRLTNNTFAVHVLGDGKITEAGKAYKLETIELHSPSGHWIKEKFYPLEIHLVHKNTDGEILIVAVFANIGSKNPTLKTLLEHSHSEASKTNFFPFDMNSLLPAKQGYYAYNGSLPYPPCTEGVKWRVLKTPITISREQLSMITRIIGRNTRLPQPLYIREILESIS